MSDESLKIDISKGNEKHPPRRRRTNQLKVSLAVTTVVIACVGIFLVKQITTSEPHHQTGQTQVANDLPNANDTSKTSKTEIPTNNLIEDDGLSLWQSPTSGEPLDLAYVLSGTQVLLFLQCDALLSHIEGEKVLASLGPWGKSTIAQLEQISGFKLDEIASILLSLAPQEGGELGYSLRLQLLEPIDLDMLARRHSTSRRTTVAERRCIEASGNICFLADDQTSSTLVVCSTSVAPQLIASNAAPPPFTRDFQRLIDSTDVDRIVTLLLPSKFLITTGETWLQGSARMFGTELRQLLGNDSTSVAISMHWADNFFIELQSMVALNRQPHRFLARLSKEVSQLPNDADQAIASMKASRYSQALVERFPMMVEQLSLYTRLGIENDISTVRCYLPSAAGHNLLMATELLLNLGGHMEAGEAQKAPSLTASNIRPQTIAEALRSPTTLSFPKETLQKALEILSEDLGIPIELRGRDLQLEGITKNQSFSIEIREQPAETILLDILQRANPDRTATGPADTRQKLVYLIRESTADIPGAIVVTTRAAAKKRGETLPAVFGT